MPEELFQTIRSSIFDLVGEGIKYLPSLLTAIIAIIVTGYVVQPVRHVVQNAANRWLKSPSLQSLVVQVAVVGTWVLGGLLSCVIAFPDLRMGDLVGLLGLGSVAIGFAFQDIFKNFLAGILLLLNEPFKLGDQILVGDYEGTVEGINIRSTEIRTYQGERIVIPNAIVFTSPVEVLTDRPHRRTDVEIGLDYNTPLERARQILLTGINDVEGVLATPAPEVDLVGFGGSSIDFAVRYWTKPQKVYVRQTQSRVVIALKQACDAADFNIPYPIRTVYHFDQDRYDDHYPVAAQSSRNGHSHTSNGHGNGNGHVATSA